MAVFTIVKLMIGGIPNLIRKSVRKKVLDFIKVNLTKFKIYLFTLVTLDFLKHQAAAAAIISSSERQ